MKASKVGLKYVELVHKEKEKAKLVALPLYIIYSKCMIVPVVTTPQKMGELETFPIYILSKDSRPQCLKKQCQYSSLLGRFKADQRKLCEL